MKTRTRVARFDARRAARRASLILIAVAIIALGAAPASAGVVYQDTFNRTGNLNGSAPTINNGASATWSASTWTTSTTGGGQASISSNTKNGFLAFTPTIGNVYTYSTQIRVTSGDNNDWVAMGFSTSASPSTTANFSSGVSAVGWLYQKRDTANSTWYYSGTNTSGGTGTSGITGERTFTEVLAHNGSAWTVQFYYDGTLIGTKTLPSGTIRSIGIGSWWTSGNAHTVKNLTLSQGSTWLKTTGGSWGTTGNWSGGLVPNAAGADMTLPSIIGTNARTITLDGDRTVGQLTLANSTSSGGAYTISQGTGGTLTLDNSGSGAKIVNYWGSNLVSAPVYLNDNAQLNVSNGGTLTFSDTLSSAAGKSLTINQTVVGTPGTVVLSGSNTYTGATTVSAGTLTLNDNAQLKFLIGASGVNNWITGAGTVNLNGDFLFDLTGAGIGMGDSWTIVDVGSLTETFGGTFTVKNFTDNLDNTWTYTTGPGQYYTFTEATGVLNYVPEPATMALMALGGLGLVLSRKRK